ncbi:MAG: NAD-dependent epimerase/dehydratase family protein [Lentisphaeria bacterium]|jgi:nucleoside-diphosphate-sugar epimerase
MSEQSETVPAPPRRYAVLGGGGFLGRAIVRMLRARGDTVRVFGRHRYPEVEALGAECVVGDVRDPAAVTNACQDCHTVFHTIAICDILRSKRPYYEVNVRGSANVLRACLENKVRCLVYTSTPSVVIAPRNIILGDESLPYLKRYLSPYPKTKAIAEKMILDADNWEMVPNSPADDRRELGERNVTRLRTCAIRPHLIWGPNDPHILPRIFAYTKEKRLRVVGNGLNQVSITYVDNAAHAHILAADELAGQARCAGKAYFINDSDPVVLWEWINSLLTSLHLPTVNRRIGYRSAYIVAALCECLSACLPFLGPPKMTRFVINELAFSHSFTHDRASRDFGYQPIVSPQQALDNVIAWANQQKLSQS